MLKKVIAMLLAAAVTLSLAACGGEAGKEDASRAAVQEKKESESEPDQKENDPESWPVISVDVLSFTDQLERKDEVEQALNEYLVSIDAGVQAEFIVGTWGDRSNNLTMLLTDSDNPIDLFCWRFYSSVDALVKNDQVISLDLYKDAYPELFTMFPEAVYLACQVNGEQYSLPNADSFGNFCAYMLRKSVAEEIGVADKDGSEITLEELNEILIRAEEAFPDQSWWGDLSPLSIKGVDNLGDDYWLGVLMDRGVGEMEIVNYYESDEFRQWCEQTRWYNENGMVPADPENTVPTGTLYQDNVTSGGWLDGYSLDYIRSLLHGQGKTGDGDFILFKLTDYLGKNSCIYNGWCISSLCKNPDAAMKLLNLMMTDEKVCRFFTLGIEGVTYKVNENGCAELADGVDDSTVGWNLSAPWFYPNQCLSIPYNTEMSTYYTDMEKCWFDENSEFSKGMGFVFDNSSVYDQVKACQMIIDQYRDALLYGEVEVDKYLTKLNEELKEAGIDAIIDEKNAQFQAFLSAKGE